MADNKCPNCYEIYGTVKPRICKKCGFPFKGNNENDSEYLRTYAWFNSKTTEELKAIINAGEEHTDIAKQVARDIIETGRPNYKINTKEPLYEEIHMIARDLRFIKNVIIVVMVCAIVIGIIVMVRTL